MPLPSYFRVTLLVLGLSNLGAAVLWEFGVSASFGLTYGTIMSNYRSMDRAGAIVHSKLAEVWDERAAADWTIAVKKLVDGPLSGLYSISHVVTLGLVVNAGIALTLWWGLRRWANSSTVDAQASSISPL